MSEQENKSKPGTTRECLGRGTFDIHKLPPSKVTSWLLSVLDRRGTGVPVSKGDRLITVIVDHLIVIYTPIRGRTPILPSLLCLVGRAFAVPAGRHRDASTTSSCDS